jgi:hypothetical protein
LSLSTAADFSSSSASGEKFRMAIGAFGARAMASAAWIGDLVDPVDK